MLSKKIKIAFLTVLVVLISIITVIGIYNYIIPKSISVFSSDIANDTKECELNIPFVSLNSTYSLNFDNNSSEICRNDFCVSIPAKASLFGSIPLKKLSIDMFSNIKLYPGGMPFGVKLYTEGVIIVGVSTVETENGNVNPNSENGLKVRDIITEINGKAVNTTDEVADAIENSEGKPILFKVKRDGQEIEVEISPVYSKADKLYKAGIWIRDSTAGIGTVTFIVPNDNTFGGLGHGICDVDTGELMPLRKGTVVDVTINGVTKGQVGVPGELKGSFSSGKIGSLIGNTLSGVYGVLSENLETNEVQPMEIGLRDDIKVGPASIYCTVNDKLDSYSAEIIKISNKDSEQKNFVIKITDKRLLEATGGIVQGMSGSPVIQNNKIVGAVTHVLVNDPTKGYGIFIENMLKNMPELTH